MDIRSITNQHTLSIAIAILMAVLVCHPSQLMAQKKELSQARTYLKSRNKNYTQAEQLMNGLLRDSVHRTNKHVYQVLFEAVKGQYDQANERLYLKQRQDTAAFFNLARRMFTIAETLDSLDVLPDKKGRINPIYRQKHASMLNTYRPNLFNAGSWFVRKGKWSDAFNYMETYMDCAQQPLFTSYNYHVTDSRMPEAAYWATYSAYRMQDAERTLRYHDLAMRDTTHADFTLQFTAEAHRWHGDKGSYVATLEEGFRRYPAFPYFFPRLMDAYTEAERYDKALVLADSALQICDTCELYLFAKSSTLLRLERWEESVVYSEKLIRQNDSLPEPYFNAGTAYVNMAEGADSNTDKKIVRTYYQKARTYMEYYRQLMPDEKKKWAPVLYRIYLNLNLGKQFDEIDRLLKNP